MEERTTSVCAYYPRLAGSNPIYSIFFLLFFALLWTPVAVLNYLNSVRWTGRSGFQNYGFHVSPSAGGGYVWNGP